MTGFARSDGARDGTAWHWEIKSVNGKGLDLRTRLPYGLEALEPGLREVAAKHLRRGNLQVALQISKQAGAAALRVNEDALEQVVAIAVPLARRLGAPAPTAEGLLGLRGILEQAEAEPDEAEIEARNAAIMQSFNEACTALATARATEGEKLHAFVSAQVDEIERLADAARDCPVRTPEAIAARLAEQIARLNEAADTLDPDRLHQEAMVMAAKADVQEELDRLYAHIAAARELLADPEPVGRKFDFLAQEFNREANTLCSKSAAPELNVIGLELKVVIDQLREQVQNIE